MAADAARRAPFVVVDGRTVEFERTPCNYCRGDREELLFEGRDRLLGLPGVFRVVRCADCGLVRQNPSPSAATIDAYYPPAYEPFSCALAEEPSRRRRWDRRYGLLKRRWLTESYRSDGRILDVGCATGNFLAEMAGTGRWTAVGVEPSQDAARYAAEHLGLDIRAGRLSDVDLPDGSFDVVTLWNVLEHLHRPIDDLRLVRDLLKPGGWLVFSVPNLESFEARLFRDRWFGWELPRHLYFFPRPVLGRVLGDLGFTVEGDTCLSGGHLSFAASFERLYFGQPARPRWHRAAAAVLNSWPGRLALLPAFYLLGKARQSMIITLIARKR